MNFPKKPAKLKLTPAWLVMLKNFATPLLVLVEKYLPTLATFLFNSGSAATQVLLYHSLLYNTTKLRLTLPSENLPIAATA